MLPSMNSICIRSRPRTTGSTRPLVSRGLLGGDEDRQARREIQRLSTTLGIAMGSFLGGRSETRIRLQEVPVDFISEYPSTRVLLGLWNIVTAKTLTFPDATRRVKELLSRITLDDCFGPELWLNLRFFALVRAKKHILPVRTIYNETTSNIGNNYLTSTKPIWIAGPDLIASTFRPALPWR
jgi:hypothetical protein